MKKYIIAILIIVMAISTLVFNEDSIAYAIEPSASNEIEFTDETLPVDKVGVEGSVDFVDISPDDWFYQSVMFVKDEGLMGGVSGDEFAPQESVTRAMLVVVLHRLEGEPKSESSKFVDVEDGQWCSDGISWAANAGIVNGVGEGMFEPDAPITREQIATIIYKYSAQKGKIDAQSIGIIAPDKDKISDWALEGMSWAVGQGLINGKDGGVLDPGGEATRAEIATILMRFIQNS